MRSIRDFIVPPLSSPADFVADDNLWYYRYEPPRKVSDTIPRCLLLAVCGVICVCAIGMRWALARGFDWIGQ